MSINTSDLTTVDLDGSGVFDVLMRATVVHLQEEFKSGRITGANYTNVYLNGLQAVLAQSVAYSLQKEQSDAQTELIKEQVTRTQLESTNLDTQNDILNKELEKLTQEVSLAQIQVQVAQQQLSNLAKEGLQTEANTSLIEQNAANAVTQGTILSEQVKRAEKEVELTQKRIETETAKTSDKIDGVDVGGSVGKQIKLYQAQTDGFQRDAEQKAFKVCSDMWSTAKATDATGLLKLPSELEEVGLNDMISKLKQGINI